MFLNPINLKPMTNQELLVYKLVTDKYLNTDYRNGLIKPKANNCIDLDRNIQQISEEVSRLRISEPDNQLKVSFLMYAKQKIINMFNNYDCRNKIEETRFDESGKLITQAVIKQEKTVLGQSNLENNIYIFIGATVFITALVILIKNKK